MGSLKILTTRLFAFLLKLETIFHSTALALNFVAQTLYNLNTYVDNITTDTIEVSRSIMYTAVRMCVLLKINNNLNAKFAYLTRFTAFFSQDRVTFRLNCLTRT